MVLKPQRMIVRRPRRAWRNQLTTPPTKAIAYEPRPRAKALSVGKPARVKKKVCVEDESQLVAKVDRSEIEAHLVELDDVADLSSKSKSASSERTRRREGKESHQTRAGPSDRRQLGTAQVATLEQVNERSTRAHLLLDLVRLVNMRNKRLRVDIGVRSVQAVHRDGCIFETAFAGEPVGRFGGPAEGEGDREGRDADEKEGELVSPHALVAD